MLFSRRMVGHFPTPAERLVSDGPCAMVASNAPIREDPHSIQVISRLGFEVKEWQHAGVIGIPAKLLKVGGDWLT